MLLLKYCLLLSGATLLGGCVHSIQEESLGLNHPANPMAQAGTAALVTNKPEPVPSTEDKKKSDNSESMEMEGMAHPHP